MVLEQLQGRDIEQEEVLRAMRRVPRHVLIPESAQELAYADRPLPIGERQTISQPYIVAAMTQALQLKPGSRVLEIGTGSGYQAAVLAEITDHVYTIEIVEELGRRSRKDLEELGYSKIQFRLGDGYQGWPESAPFDAIIVTAAPPHIPQSLIDQLAIGGRLVIPVGVRNQDLLLIEKTEDGSETRSLMGVRFVPMTGEAQD
jgi:protein-L-isoaspartate(D-aspartate) O-methyltransferase